MLTAVAMFIDTRQFRGRLVNSLLFTVRRRASTRRYRKPESTKPGGVRSDDLALRDERGEGRGRCEPDGVSCFLTMASAIHVESVGHPSDKSVILFIRRYV